MQLRRLFEIYDRIKSDLYRLRFSYYLTSDWERPRIEWTVLVILHVSYMGCVRVCASGKIDQLSGSMSYSFGSSALQTLSAIGDEMSGSTRVSGLNSFDEG